MTPRRGTATASIDELVRAAAERATERYREGVLLVPEVEPLRQEMASVVDAVSAALEGRDEEPPREGTADPLRLLQALRTEVVRDWPEDLPLLPLMQAFERVQARLLKRRESPTGDRIVPTPRSLLREVAHMLRSPLGSVVLLADTLSGQGADLPVERRNKQLGIIHNAALGLASSAGDLLTLIDEEDGLGAPKDFAPADVLETVADIVRPVAEVRGCRLSVSEVEIGEVEGGHPTAVTRALLSIALRVVRRTRDGTVDLSAVREDGTVRFTVRGESGSDAPEGVESALFEIFRLDDSVGKSYTLSAEGMGLASAARLLRAMGSELRVESEAPGPLVLSFSLGAQP